ncbi:hypothetical protein pEaSNUABM34_00035 [Erwinia phage pEa_SNUABM_34]|uniref:Uncharacterized protein n=1 Tax=Erwinia phage pEa_SNUABM_7 TaxID=2866695 RepID=A0AAE7WUA4_9CAUD|nr:hypothetical protein MPK74_gp035 [Erwinia phage pEa_SNUABM_7]QYW03337.1 hypothetical protein pEaSNUABM34_00035 [Erwinia phage pEa_SNUABM_34]QYW04703.1 hypothetical protein pEaSNUABM7_00035 [Erwinia phage pEa_SNUABM_7]QYW05050.1 hypothetical protein pEaSNUABM21_00036 [Erwinia phage pEa_SNUABM_21]QYW05391.1 hypothetical protein pEaSNUABM25_00035 [Erwinia phage pEa_SNUABM_25]
MSIALVVEMNHVEQIDTGYENSPIFRIQYIADKSVAPADYIREKLVPKAFPFGVDKAVVQGHDYMVLTAIIDGTEHDVCPGDLLVYHVGGRVTYIAGATKDCLVINGDGTIVIS